MRIFSGANYQFLSYRRKAYVLSAIVISAGLLGATAWKVSTGTFLNYGVDFTGGTLMQVHFAEPVTVGEVRAAVGDQVPGDPTITRFGADDEYLIRVAAFEDVEEGENVSDLVQAALESSFGEGNYTVVRTEAVGPKIGEELQQRAILAVLLSFVLTLIYLAFRFEWRFGIAAVIATVHDILLAMGFIAAFNLEVSLPTVAAVLTIIGYSLNDTIVVFDRVRENLKNAGRRANYEEVVNRSINDVLPRTIMTSGTTLVVLLSLFVLGGEIIRGFALILILGVVIGTYSSIFVASPALLEIEHRWKRKKERGTRTPRPSRAGAGV